VIIFILKEENVRRRQSCPNQGTWTWYDGGSPTRQGYANGQRERKFWATLQRWATFQRWKR